MKKIISIIMCILLCTLTFAGCGDKNKTNNENKSTSNVTADQLTGHPQVKVTMENGGTFTIELYPEYAPETCANFINLVNEKFYDGLTFHRVVDGFMAQGGSSDGEGYKGSDETIKGEFAQNGFTQNTLKHERGVVSMARATDPNSASSQFFICYDTSSFLDGGYAAFGKVIDGMEVVDDFCNVERTLGSDGAISKPVDPIIIKTMEVVK